MQSSNVCHKNGAAVAATGTGPHPPPEGRSNTLPMLTCLFATPPSFLAPSLLIAIHARRIVCHCQMCRRCRRYSVVQRVIFKKVTTTKDKGATLFATPPPPSPVCDACVRACIAQSTYCLLIVNTFKASLPLLMASPVAVFFQGT